MMTGNLLGSLIVLGLAGRTYGLCDSDTVRGYTKMGSGGICSGSAPSHPSTKKKNSFGPLHFLKTRVANEILNKEDF